MSKEPNNKRLSSKHIAFSGIISACAIVAMLIGSYMTAAAYVCTAIASFLIYTVREECNLRYALAAYVCVSILSILFVPYKKMVWLFVLLIGYYPLVKAVLDKIPHKWLRIVGKLALCNCTMVFVFFGTAKMLYNGELMPEIGRYAKIAAVLFVIAGNVAFLCYDFALHKILMFYRKTISPKLGKIVGLR